MKHQKAFLYIISHVPTKDIAISNDYIKKERERFTEKLGVFEIFGADEKNFKRSLRHLWRERTQVVVGMRKQ